MSAAFTVVHTLVRLAGLAVTVLGVVLLTTQNVALAPVYATMAVALMLSMWTLACLAARAGAHAGLLVLTVLVGVVPPVVSLSGEWPLYVLAGVSALAQTEDLALRVRRRHLELAGDSPPRAPQRS